MPRVVDGFMGAGVGHTEDDSDPHNGSWRGRTHNDGERAMLRTENSAEQRTTRMRAVYKHTQGREKGGLFTRFLVL